MLIRWCSIFLFLLSTSLSATKFRYTKNLIQFASSTYGFGGKTAKVLGYLNIGPRAYYDSINLALKEKNLIYVSATTWSNLKRIKEKIALLSEQQRRHLACVVNGECFMMARKCKIATALEMVEPDGASHLIPFATLPFGLSSEERQMIENFDSWLNDRIKKCCGTGEIPMPQELSELLDIRYEERSALLPSWEEFLSLLVDNKLSDNSIQAKVEKTNANILGKLTHFEMSEKGNVVVLLPLGSVPYLEKELVRIGLERTGLDWMDYASLPQSH